MGNYKDAVDSVHVRITRSHQLRRQPYLFNPDIRPLPNPWAPLRRLRQFLLILNDLRPQWKRDTLRGLYRVYAASRR